jgi:SAM-dependent methyltransferase/methyltransferase-like protein
LRFQEETLDRAQNPYDALAYPGQAYRNTHPDNLAAMAILHGLSPALVARCRVLEVACGDGANLIPMAYAAPASEFVGFDLAALPIKRGQKRVRELGLKNIRLFQGDLLEVGAELGSFDYIIAHGFYAWVPAQVRDRLLALLSELLTPDGIAFVSYNALPGSYLRTMARDLMRFGAYAIDSQRERVAQGLNFLRFVAENREEGDLFRTILDAQLKRLEKRDPAATSHDELSGEYLPVYFSDFVADARQHGLQYLSEAELPPPPDPCYRAEIQPALDNASGGDDLRKEQLLDLLRMRPYRETLLCKSDCTLQRGFPAEHFQRLLFASQTAATPAESPGATVFTLPGGIKMESNHPGVTAMLRKLGAAWPRALGFEELEPVLKEAGFSLNAEFAGFLLRLAVAKMIELHAWPAPVAPAVTERPRASAICRSDARANRNATSLLHRTVSMDDARMRSLLLLLDGTRNRNELLRAMKAEFPDTPAVELETGLEPGLRFLHKAGMLEA